MSTNDTITTTPATTTTLAQPPAEGSIVTGWILRPAPKDKSFVLARIEGGLTGILHESQVRGSDRNARSERLHSLKSNDTLELVVIKAGKGEKDGALRIELSERPIVAAERRQQQEEYAASLEGSNRTGKVTGFLKSKDGKDERIGAFVEMEHGVRGLLHISQVSGDDRNAQRAAIERLEEGDEVTVTVLSVARDGDRLRIALSQRHQEQQEYLQELRAADKKKGRVVGTSDGNYKVDLGKGVLGLLPTGALQATLRKGDRVWVKVENIDPNGTVRLTRNGVK